MALFREFTDAGKDPGVGHVLGHDKDINADVIVYVRSIPQRVENDIRKRFRDRKPTTVTVRDGAPEIQVSADRLEVTRDTLRARAAIALAETKNFEVMIGDAITAETYKSLVPSKADTVQVGKSLRLDGCWTDELRAHVLAEHADLAQWIITKVDASRFVTTSEEEDLSSN